MPTRLYCLLVFVLSFCTKYKKKIHVTNECYMCHQTMLENARHLFFHGKVAAGIWSMFLSVFGIAWVMRNSIKKVYESGCSWRVGKPIKKTWHMVPAAIFGCIWNERNRRCFDRISTPYHILKSNCLVFLYSWFNQDPVTTVDLFLDFICSLVI